MTLPKNKFIAIGLCATVCAGMILFAGGCSEEEPPPVVVAAPPPPPPPPPAPTVTPIEQLMAEMNIDPRVSLPEEKAPGTDVERRAVLSFFDGFARGNDTVVGSMLPETDRPHLNALVKSGVWKDTAGRVTKIDIQCGNAPDADPCALAVFEVSGGGEMFQPQLWKYQAGEDASTFEAQSCPPGIMDQLAGDDWISRWFQIIEKEETLASQADEEFAVAQRDLDDDSDAGGGSGPAPQRPGTLRSPSGTPQEAPGIPGGGDGPR